jgi:NUDIX domain
MPPGGYSTGLAEPEARSVQEVWDRGRRVTFTWFDPPFRPEPPHSNQAYGICFTGTGMIVLGACDVDGERYWNLLGGGVEPGETLEDCLVREVMEEGCARVVQSRYIGCQRVDDPEPRPGPGATTRRASGLGSSSCHGIDSTRSTSAAWSGLKTFSAP